MPGGLAVVGVDGSPTSEAVLAFAVETASMRGTSLTAAVCWQDFMVENAYTASRFTVDWAHVEEDERRLPAQVWLGGGRSTRMCRCSA